MVENPPANLLDLLSQSPLFLGAGKPALRAANKAARSCRIEKGEFFFFQDEPADAFYVITAGSVRLSQLTPEGHQIIIHLLGPGEAMGIVVVLSDAVYPASAEAMTACEALKWDLQTTMDLLAAYPQLAINGLQLLTSRFHELQNRYRELATERVERRIARALLRLVTQAGRRINEGVLLDLPLTRQDLAEMTGTTQYTVSRTLSRWEQQGLVKSGRDGIVVHEPHGLVLVAEDLPVPGEPGQ